MTPEPTTLRTAREETIDALCRGFADDHLSLGELERRLEKARGARTRQDLNILLADLPASPAPVPSAGPRPRQPERSSGASTATAGTRPTPATRRTDGEARPVTRRSSHLAFAVMGGTRRAGRWAPPSSMAAVALMGGVELDFRDAVLGDGDIEINCFAFWGGVEITVPPNVHVDTRGFAIMGGFDQTAELATNPDPDAPTIRINGFALMGAVEVKVAEPGEKLSKRDW